MKKILISVSLVLLLSCVPEKYKNRELYVPEPKVYKLDNAVNAIDFLPESYDIFFYLKNSKEAFEIFQDGEFYNSIKDNYLYMDLKYSYLENIDLFFTKFDFNFNSIFKYINSDTLFGLTKNSFFLVASMTFESKILISLLNIAPDSIIGESVYAGHTIYSVKKGNNSLFYTVINGYIIFADTISGIKESITSVVNPETDYTNYIEGVENNEVIYVTKINSSNNPFDIFPLVSEVAVNYNVENHKISFNATPDETFYSYVDRNDENYHETLKYLSAATPMLYYNASYKIKDILTPLLTDEGYFLHSDTIERLERILGGVYFLVDDIEPLFFKNDPGLGLILNIKPDGSDYNDILRLIENVLGVKWIEENRSEGVTLYKAEDSSFSLVTKSENIGVFTNSELAGDFYERSLTPQYSLYDQNQKHFSDDNKLLDSYLTYNPLTISDTSIKLIKRYLFSKIHMTEDEYSRSFGDIIELVSGFKPGYIEYKFNEESGKFYGSIKTKS